MAFLPLFLIYYYHWLWRGLLNEFHTSAKWKATNDTGDTIRKDPCKLLTAWPEAGGKQHAH